MMRIPALKTLLIGSFVFCVTIVATLQTQTTKPAPPTPVDKKKVELGGSPWDPEWDQIVEKALPAAMLSAQVPRDVLFDSVRDFTRWTKRTSAYFGLTS